MKENSIINAGKMKKIVIFAIFILFSPTTLLAKTNNKYLLSEYRVEGIAAIEERNNENARVAAMNDAFKNAVRLAANVVLQRDPSTEEREGIEEILVGESKRYVEGYRMLSETFDDEYCSVHMSVTLFQSLLNKDLSGIGLKPNSSDSPLVLLLIEEKILPVYNRDNFMSLFSISEEAIVKKLAKEKWNIVGRKGLPDLANQKKIGKGIDGNIKAIVSIAKEVEAAIVVVGSASIDLNSNGRSRLSLRVVSVNSGKVLGENIFTGYSGSKDPLLAKTAALKTVSAKGSLFISDILKREIGVRGKENSQPIAVPIQAR